MIHPTIEELTKGEFNRYELVVGVAKGARLVTDEYVEMRANAQRLIDNHETDKNLSALIDPEYKDQKAVKIAIARLNDGRLKMYRPEEREQQLEQIEEPALEKTAEEALVIEENTEEALEETV